MDLVATVTEPVANSMLMVTEAQQTERLLTMLIGLLLVIAALLAVLTFWYWRHTDPRRQSRPIRTGGDRIRPEPEYQRRHAEPVGHDGWEAHPPARQPRSYR